MECRDAPAGEVLAIRKWLSGRTAKRAPGLPLQCWPLPAISRGHPVQQSATDGAHVTAHSKRPLLTWRFWLLGFDMLLRANIGRAISVRVGIGSVEPTQRQSPL